MNLKKHKLFVLTLAAVSIISIAGCGTAKENAPEVSDELPTNCPIENPAPADNSASEIFSKMDTKDLEGNAAGSADFAQNKLTLVNVWNVGCTPCVEEIPVLDQLNKEYAEKGAAIKGLYHDFAEGISDESRKEVEKILSEAKADYQQLLLSKEMVESDTITNLVAFPTTFLVNSEGKIIDTLEGSRDYEGWKKVIEDGLKQVEGNE